jgi:hypothetical protein
VLDTLIRSDNIIVGGKRADPNGIAITPHVFEVWQFADVD